MKLSTDVAKAVLREEARQAEIGSLDADWLAQVERLSRLCAEGVSSTHIAFLGTAMLAKAVNADVDLFAIKPKHAEGNERAYSARSLCHSALVPVAAELGISLGVTGREPLNNQPYFRMTRLGDGTPVHAGGRAAFDCMVGLVGELDAMQTEAEARAALRAFVAVRRRYQPRYGAGEGVVRVTPEGLAACIARLVTEDSEGGSRAQAVVAGLFDVVVGAARVESGRINDPSRRYPGDVCVRSAEGGWEKAVEVRDKIVRLVDVQIFGQKCVEMGVREAAIVMVSPRQARLDEAGLAEWAAGLGLGLTLFHGWSVLVDQALFWAPRPKPEAAVLAVGAIEVRLVGVEASPEAVALWQALTRESQG